MPFQIDTAGTLETSLRAYWKLEEVSGTRDDAFSTNNLTDNNTVTQAVGKVGSAAQLTATNQEWLSVADNPDLSGGDVDFSIACWAYLDSKGTLRGLVVKGDWNNGIGWEYLLEYNSNSDRFKFSVRNTSDTATASVQADSLGSPSLATWYFIVAWHDSTANTINIQVNNGTVDSTAHSGGVNDSNKDFVLGSYMPTGGGFVWDGRIDEVGFWKKVLSAQEKTDLYNGGSGQTFISVTTVTQTIASDTSIQGTVEQNINDDTTILSGQPQQTIQSDSNIAGQIVQTIGSNTSIPGTTGQSISSDTAIKHVGVIQPIGADSLILLQPAQVITSSTIITVNEAELKLFKESDLTTEIGTSGNPLTWGTLEAGDSLVHPDSPFVLFNDKGGTLRSVDAREVTVSVVQLDILDELVGTSNGTASQTFSVAFPPALDDNDLITVKVNNISWTRVTSFAGFSPTDQIYTFDATTGQATFGDNLQGQIPPNGHTIKVSYIPNTILYGREAAEQLWVSVQSNGVISNPVNVSLEQNTPTDTLHVQVLHAPVSSVGGVFLLSDPNKLGTNFFTGGSFISTTGVITLGTALPNTNDVWVEYIYTIADDLEGTFTVIGRTVKHTFAGGIPSNNGKKINFRVMPPATASPSGIGTIRFKLRIEYRE